MTNSSIILICYATLMWYIAGVSSFIYWWTKDYNFTTSNLLMGLFAGVIGPVAWVMGWIIHGSGTTPRTLIKRRGGKG